MVALGDMVTIILDITSGTTATGRIVELGKRYVIIECADGSREIGDRRNVKAE